jgi:hypothetical protein
MWQRIDKLLTVVPSSASSAVCCFNFLLKIHFHEGLLAYFDINVAVIAIVVKAWNEAADILLMHSASKLDSRNDARVPLH